ncbi:MAG: hypothetical protein Q9170_006976 [Blastenia crenularia]
MAATATLMSRKKSPAPSDTRNSPSSYYCLMRIFQSQLLNACGVMLRFSYEAHDLFKLSKKEK